MTDQTQGGRHGSSRRPRGLARGRHGRELRSSLAGPFLPRLTGRALEFELAVESSVSYAKMLAPELLEDIEVEVGTIPPENVNGDGVDRWHLVGDRGVIIYRVPLERLEHLHCDDPIHVRALVERTVLEALGARLGLDPWEIAPDRYGDAA